MQCRRTVRGGIILKDVSLFDFLSSKDAICKCIQISKLIHCLLSEPLYRSGRCPHTVCNFIPRLLLEIIPPDHFLLPLFQETYVMKKSVSFAAEISIF